VVHSSELLNFAAAEPFKIQYDCFTLKCSINALGAHFNSKEVVALAAAVALLSSRSAGSGVFRR
jgi:hypothetical protein